MKKFQKYIILFLTVVLIISLAGCQSRKRPKEPENQQAQKEAEKTKEAPKIPKAINQGEGQEPKLVVYIADEKTNKEMAFEEYLQGVVAGEMKKDWPIEALKAQTILARSFVMEFVDSKGSSKYEGAHISTDIEEAQAWNASEINENIVNAVNSTRGQVLVHDNKYIKAWFHAHAGGRTANAVEGLGYDEGNPPYIESVESPDSKEAPEEDTNWSATFTKGEIIEAVRASGQETGDFDKIEITERGPSGRAYKLQIGQANVLAPAFRVALDSTKMKSTQIKDITVSDGKVTITGTGYGHGVGMSQWGAYQMAKEGKNAEDIINHYFKDVDIVQLWK